MSSYLIQFILDTLYLEIVAYPTEFNPLQMPVSSNKVLPIRGDEWQVLGLNEERIQRRTVESLIRADLLKQKARFY
jgi:hypothetical protein